MHRISRGIGIVAALACAAALSGCSSAREALGIAKQSPDEFAVVTRAPLTLPPNYSLRPPDPGAPRPQEINTENTARDLLLGDSKDTGSGKAVAKSTGPKLSKGEDALLAKAGATNVDPAIRAEVDRESSILATRNQSFTDKLIFWQASPPPGSVVDAAKEKQRLQENAALGKPPTAGPTPRIEHKPKGWLEGLF